MGLVWAAGSDESGKVGSVPAEGLVSVLRAQGKAVSIAMEAMGFPLSSPVLQPGLLPESHPSPLLPSLLYLGLADFIWK